MYEELQLLIKSIGTAIERFENDTSRFGYDGSQMIPQLKACLDDPSSAIRLFRETSEQSPDKTHRPYIWDYEVYYRGGLVRLRYLIEKLEKLWGEHLMQLEGGP
jgi:hypothetical protein